MLLSLIEKTSVVSSILSFGKETGVPLRCRWVSPKSSLTASQHLLNWLDSLTLSLACPVSLNRCCDFFVFDAFNPNKNGSSIFSGVVPAWTFSRTLRIAMGLWWKRLRRSK